MILINKFIESIGGPFWLGFGVHLAMLGSITTTEASAKTQDLRGDLQVDCYSQNTPQEE